MSVTSEDVYDTVPISGNGLPGKRGRWPHERRARGAQPFECVVRRPSQGTQGAQPASGALPVLRTPAIWQLTFRSMR